MTAESALLSYAAKRGRPAPPPPMHLTIIKSNCTILITW
jgi:hypothetical protein